MRANLLLLPIVLALSACVDRSDVTTEADRGTMALCLGSDGDASINGESATFTFTGTVTVDTPADDMDWSQPTDGVVGCGVEPSRVLEVLGDDGTTWWVGYGLWDEAGADGTPALEVSPGAPVDLVFRAIASFGSAAGVAVHSDDVLVLAMEQGTWGPALQPDDVPGLTVSLGALTEESTGGCADMEDYALIFAADTGVEVPTGESAEVLLGGVPMTAAAVSAWEYVPPVCPDGAGEVLWSVWRSPTE